MFRPVHFEINSKDPERLAEFFTKVFDWKVEKWGDQDYWMVDTHKNKGDGIGGGIQKGTPGNNSITLVIDVDDIDAYIQKVKDAGGVLTKDKQDIPDVGTVAYFTDPDGNEWGMIQDVTKS